MAWLSEDGLPGNVVRDVKQDSLGYIWVGTAEGVAKFDGKTFYQADDDLWHRAVRSLFVCDDEIWISTPRGGLMRAAHDNIEEIIAPTSNVSDADVTGVIKTGSDYLIKKGEKTLLYSKGTIQETKDAEFPERQQQTSYTDKKGNTWYQDEENHLIMRDATGRVYNITDDERQNITGYYEDREGNIWVLTAVNGLRMIYPARVEMLGEPFKEAGFICQGIIQDASEVWWLSGREGGVYRIINGFRHEALIEEESVNRPISCLYETKDHRIFLSTKDGIVMTWDGNSMQQVSNNLMCQKVNQMAEDSEGTLWMAGAYGLASYTLDRKLKQHITREELGGVSVNTLASDKKNGFYLGLLDGRVLHWSKGQWKDMNLHKRSGNRHISSFKIIKNGWLVATSLGSGIHVYDGKEWHSWDDKNGLPDSRITDAETDNDGNLWLASLGGIFRIQTDQILTLTPELSVLWLDRSDGMKSRECSGYTHPGIFRAKSGDLYFPTTAGLAKVRPKSISNKTKKPYLYITSCTANGKPLENTNIAGTGLLTMKWTYTSPEFATPEKIHYYTRLLPLQKNWQAAKSESNVSYEALPHGKYQFEVRAINGDGIMTDVARYREIIIQPFWWQSTWFRVIMITALVALSALIPTVILRMKMRKRLADLKLKHARENERTRIARDLHDDLGASLTEISLIADLHNPGEKDHPLERISEKSHAVIRTLDEIVWAINPRHDTSISIVEYLSAYAQEFLGNTDITLRLQIPVNIPNYHVTTEKRHALFSSLREALNNLVKHSNTTDAQLTCAADESQLIITLSDNGVGFDSSLTHSGDGLINLRERLIAYGGSTTIKSIAGSGTTVQFILPWK